MGGEGTGACSRPASRGGWGQRAPKDQSRNLGDPSSWVEPNAPGNRQAAAAEVGGARSSEEAGNDRGAKGPYRTKRVNQREEFRLDRDDPTTVQGVLFDEARKDPRGPIPPKLE